VAFSLALEDGSFHEQLPTLQGEDYGAGWRSRTEYHDLTTPVPSASFGERLVPLRFKHYAFDGNGHVRQGYFFPFELAGLKVVLSVVREDLPEWLEAYRAGFVLIPEEISEPSQFIKGAASTITVNRYERDREARRLCIEHHGAMCQACGIDLGERYGEVASGLIHVHHKTPLSEIGQEYEVDPINDLSPACPNCHAVIHLRAPPYSIEEVKLCLRKK
jgi:hypothetical protein